MIDPRITRYENAHANIAHTPISFKTMRDYLDCLWELNQARKGINYTLLNTSIQDIKIRGRLAYMAMQHAA